MPTRVYPLDFTLTAGKISNMLKSAPKSQTLPDYSVRISNRAKRLQLKIKPPGIVEVVLPRGMSPRHVPGFVAEHTHWIQVNIKQFKQQPQPQKNAEPPVIIELPACEERWQVRYKEGTNKNSISQDKSAMMLTVCTKKKQHQHAGLQHWLSQRAKAVLPPWLRSVSEELGLPYNRVTVRAQKTRWGSCSSKKNINLNRALLLLPAENVRYLFVHELCHTVHLNHSARYWALVNSIEPQHRRHERALNDAAKTLPHWAIPAP
ncbi:M48 family metallopeptidase [Pseudomonadota bacterium]